LIKLSSAAHVHASGHRRWLLDRYWRHSRRSTGGRRRRTWSSTSSLATTTARRRQQGRVLQQTLQPQSISLPIAEHPGVSASQVQCLTTNTMGINLVLLQASFRPERPTAAVCAADEASRLTCWSRRGGWGRLYLRWGCCCRGLALPWGRSHVVYYDRSTALAIWFGSRKDFAGLLERWSRRAT
jgi:hypothetical protein